MLIGVAAAPTLTVLLGIFLNAQGLRDIRAESRADRSDLSAKMEQLGKDVCRPAQLESAEPEPTPATPKTLSGRSKADWLAHIEKLFEIAHDGEDIPFNALLAWTGKPTEEDIAWAKKEIVKLQPDSSSIGTEPEHLSVTEQGIR